MIPPKQTSLFRARRAQPALRRRDGGHRDAPAARRGGFVSTVRLIGFFVGGILLANLVLMASAALRGYAAQTPPASASVPGKRGPAAAVAAEQAMQPAAAPATGAETDARAAPDPQPAAQPATETGKLSIAAVCAEAREKLIAGLTHYYLQRGRHPRASVEEVTESAEFTALLAGPADPSVPPGKPCAS